MKRGKVANLFADLTKWKKISW